MSTSHRNNLKERAAQGLVTHDNTGGYFVVECQGCNAVFPSFQCVGGGQIADTGDYDDARCPHCGQEAPEECDNVGLAWNTQQERINALQQLLNAKDQKDDDLSFQLKDREGSRRDWFDEAKRLEKEVEELRAEVKRLDLMGAQSDYNYDQRRAQFDRVLAERDALLRECASEFSTAEASVFEAEMRRKIEAALSASAEPAKSCGACGSCADGCRLDRESPPVERHQGELVHMVRTHGSCCWEEVGSGSLEDFKSMPEEYELRTLYTRPAEQPAPVAVVLPERKPDASWLEFDSGWNDCLDEVARLNPPQKYPVTDC